MKLLKHICWIGGKGKLTLYIKMYGYFATIYRLLNSISRNLFKITYERIYLLSYREGRCFPVTSLTPDNVEIKKVVSMDEFKRTDWKQEVLTDEKIIEYNNRFHNKQDIAYGVYENSELVSIGWIHFCSVAYGNIVFLANDQVAMLCDQYTLKNYRGHGYHKLLINECLKGFASECAKRGKKYKLSTLAFTYNRPSIKNQIKLGFVVEKTYSILHIGRRRWIF